MSYASPAIRISDFMNYGLMFRFVRLQVQLKASEENSKTIVAAIQRSKNIQSFFYADMVIYVVAYLINQMAKPYVDQSDIISQI